ncbi:MAG: phasin family protein [Pseudomonadota bacterium]
MPTKKNVPDIEIPEQMRDFASTSVDQARKAFEDYVSSAKTAVESAETQAEAVATGARDMNTKALSFAEENVASAFQFAQKMISAKNPAEMMELQRAYMEDQTRALSDQSRAIGEAVASMTSNITPKG